MRIYKYTLKAEPGLEVIDVVDNSIIVPVQYQMGEPVVWAISEDESSTPKTKKVTFLKVETGRVFNFEKEKMYNYLSTVQFANGQYVLHFFLVTDLTKEQIKRMVK